MVDKDDTPKESIPVAFLGYDSMTITAGTIGGAAINIIGVPLNGDDEAVDLRPTALTDLLRVDEGGETYMKEVYAWRERFPEHSYNHETGLISYKVSTWWDEEN